MSHRTQIPAWLADADREFTGRLRAELAIDDLLARVKSRAMVRELGADASSARLGPAVPDEIVAEALDGEREAVVRLLTVVRPLVVRYCRARLGLRGDADDVAQEVCLTVLRALPGYVPGRQSFLGFVLAIAHAKITDVRTTAAPARTELAERMRHLLRILPDQQRDIIVLRVVVGLSAGETAEALGLTPGAVRIAQHRALTRLRKEIGTDGD